MKLSEFSRLQELIENDASAHDLLSVCTSAEFVGAAAALCRQHGIALSIDEVRAFLEASGHESQAGELTAADIERNAAQVIKPDCLPSGTGALAMLKEKLEMAD